MYHTLQGKRVGNPEMDIDWYVKKYMVLIKKVKLSLKSALRKNDLRHNMSFFESIDFC